jgi:hypothetical protein
VEGPCPCGRKGRRFRHLGRRARHLKVGGEKLALEAIVEGLLGPLEVPSSACAVEVARLPGGKDVVRVKLAGDLATSGLAAAIRVGLLKAAPRLAGQVELGVVALSFEALAARDRRFGSTGKRVLVRDVRPSEEERG